VRTRRVINMPDRRGFSLIEVVLALLVVAVGMLGVFSLFPSGLSMSKDITDEVRASAFAEELFTAFEAQARWEDWASIGDPVKVDVAGESISYQDTGVGPPEEVTFDFDGMDQYTLRYELEVTEPSLDRIKRFDLKIWPGEFGPTDDADALRFVTEIYNFRIDPVNQ
jgi:uncharacterized protein (TIGR02598 family)